MRRVARITGTADDRRRRRSRSPGRSSSGSGRTRSPRSTRTTSSTSWRRSSRTAFADYRPPASVRPVTTAADGTISVAAERQNIARAAPPTAATLAPGRPGRPADRAAPRPEDRSSSTAPTTTTLTKGPGRELRTYMPGAGRARSTSPATARPTSRRSRTSTRSSRATRSRFEMPYGDVRLPRSPATGSSPADDLVGPALARHESCSILQACHPRFFATHRYIVYARLVPRHAARGGRRTDSQSGRRPRLSS